MKNKILLNPFFFLNWNGGIDVFLYFLSGIKKLDKKIELFIILPKNNFFTQIKRKIYPFYSLFNYFLKKEKFFYKWPLIEGINVIKKYIYENKIIIKIIDKDYRSLTSTIEKINPKYIFPVAKPLEKFRDKNIYYVFDLQHEYLKKYFSKNEIKNRRLEINENLNNSKLIVVNSKNTKKDLKRLYAINLKKKKIFSMPFAPNVNLNNLKFRKNINGIYNITNKYFIVCNQFWLHKNHKFIIKAFHKYYKNGGENDLIFTGETYDRRSPHYFYEIKKLINKFKLNNRIKILGNIIKNDQIYLMRNSVALIQASLFEGGPGGGSSYEAVSLNVPIFASNIKVNREMGQSKNIKYFNPHDVNNLADLLLNHTFKTKRYNIKQIKKFSEKKRKKITNFFSELFID